MTDSTSETTAGDPAAETPHRYTAALANQIEDAWQQRWEDEGTFHSANPAGPWAEPDDGGADRQQFVPLKEVV